MRPTGLYGWIRSNDGRSTVLFVGFLAAIQPIAALALFVPLALFDPAHAPFFDWSGYALRYALPVLAASVAWFAWQMLWHLQTVRRAVGFRFIDADDEPRLCRVIEPLIVAMGLPAPYVGVIDSRALNAFACGIGRRKAAVVVTRGLLDGLGDAELAAVLAHELSHIRNGDIRLIAAANIFMTALTQLHRRNPLKLTPFHMAAAVAVPVLLPLTLAGNLLGHLALVAGRVSRLMIASSREFIADAEAAEITNNPAALAAALVKVERGHRVETARAEDDAMMIAGATEGDDATHPTVAVRIAALARVTGSMVFNAPSAPAWERQGLRGLLTQAEAAALTGRLPPGRSLARIRAGGRENALGLTRWGTAMAAAAAAALVVLHAGEYDNPRALLAKFDIRPLHLMIGNPLVCMVDARSAACAAETYGGVYGDFEDQKNTLVGLLADWSRQRRAAGIVNADLRPINLGRTITREPFRGQSGEVRDASAEMTGPHSYAMAGTNGFAFTSRAPAALDVVEVEQVGCFPAKLLHGNPKGSFPLDPPQRHGRPASSDMSFARYAGWAETALVPPATAAEHDSWLRRYAEQRETLLSVSYDMFGLAGLERMRAVFAQAAHAAMLDLLRARLADPAFLAAAAPLAAAKLRALARDPARFVPCPAVRHGALKPAS